MSEKNHDRAGADAWFWTDEWQVGERRADGDYKHGCYTKCDSIEEVIALLHKLREVGGE